MSLSVDLLDGSNTTNAPRADASAANARAPRDNLLEFIPDGFQVGYRQVALQRRHQRTERHHLAAKR